MQLLVIQFTIKMFHTGFMQVLILRSLKSQYYKYYKILKLSCLYENSSNIMILAHFIVNKKILMF